MGALVDGTLPFDGYIDEVSVCQRALTEEELVGTVALSSYAVDIRTYPHVSDWILGKMKDTTEYSNEDLLFTLGFDADEKGILTTGGNIIRPVSAIGSGKTTGGGLYKQAAMGGMRVENMPVSFNGDFTISLWYKTNGAQSGYAMLLAKGEKTTGHFEFYMKDGQLYMFAPEIGDINLNANLDTSEGWHKLAFVKRSGVIYTFIDGNNIGSAAAAGTVTECAYHLAIGALLDGTLVFDGLIDEVEMYSRAFSQREQTEIFCLPPQNSDMSGLYRMMTQILPQAKTVRYFSEPTSGTLSDGKFVPNPALGSFKDYVSYAVYDAADRKIAYGNICLYQEDVPMLSVKNMEGQECTVDAKAGVVELVLPKDAKLWDLALVADAPGVITVDGVPVNGSNLFNFTEESVAKLLYTYKGETTAYALKVKRTAPDNGLSMVAILDESGKNELTSRYAINNEAGIITFYVGSTAELDSVRLHLAGPGGAAYLLNGALYTGGITALPESGTITMQGQTTMEYNYIVEKSTTPRFMLTGKAAYTVRTDDAMGTMEICVARDFDLSSVHFELLSEGKMTIDGKDTQITWFDFRNEEKAHTMLYREGNKEKTYQLSVSRMMPQTQVLWESYDRYEGTESMDASIWQAFHGTVPVVGAVHQDKAALGFVSGTGHHIIGTRSAKISPYVVEYEVALQTAEQTPQFGMFFNLRSMSNSDYPTSATGVMFSVYANKVALYTNPYGMNALENYAVAESEDLCNAETGWTKIRVTDDGNEILIEAMTTQGALIPVFRLYHIGEKTYSYINCITGITGTGCGSGNEITTLGYQSFFLHAPSKGYLRNIAFYDAPALKKSILSSVSMHDAEGLAVTTRVEMDHTTMPATINVYVAPGTDLSQISMSYAASVTGGTLYENGNDIEGQLMDYQLPKTFLYTDGVVSRVYRVTVRREDQSETILPSLDTARVRFLYPAADTDEAFFVTAFYDEQGRMLHSVIQKRPVVNGYNVLTASLYANAPQNAVTAKLYLWDAPQGGVIVDLMK